MIVVHVYIKISYIIIYIADNTVFVDLLSIFSIYLFIHISTFSVFLPRLYIYLFIYQYVFLSVCLSIHLSILSVCQIFYLLCLSLKGEFVPQCACETSFINHEIVWLMFHLIYTLFYHLSIDYAEFISAILHSYWYAYNSAYKTQFYLTRRSKLKRRYM